MRAQTSRKALVSYLAKWCKWHRAALRTRGYMVNGIEAGAPWRYQGQETWDGKLRLMPHETPMTQLPPRPVLRVVQ